MNFYNEIDPFAAAWLRELIKAGHIAPGVADERSIEDITPDELRQYTQCHFFAGIGVWSYALRQAGWPDDRPVWTGSCPCQPFSAAGEKHGFADERHLWPAFFHLIEQHRPATVFGEQVASKDGLTWLDVVSSDMEGADYSFAAADLCAAGFGAPHIRQRLYFVGHSGSFRRQQQSDELSGCVARMEPTGRQQVISGEASRYFSGMADTDNDSDNADRQRKAPLIQAFDRPLILSSRELSGASESVCGFWQDGEWLYCRDGKYRPIESGSYPLANGTPNRVGRLRGYGNAIVAPVAEAFIRAYLDTEREA